MKRRYRDAETRRSALVVILLLASLAMMGVLAWEAYDSARTQRASIEAVLRDYAALAGSEFVRRAAAAIGYSGHYKLITSLDGRMTVPTPEELSAESDPALARAASLSRTLFQVGTETGEIRTTGAILAPEVKRWLVAAIQETVAASSESDHPFFVVHGLVAGRPQSAVFTPPRKAAGANLVLGFLVDLETLGTWFSEAFLAGPLLPKSLGDGDLDNTVLALSVTDEAGTELFRGGGRYGSDLFSEIEFGNAYGGVLAGLSVRTSIDPTSASQLVIGGLPYSRLPLLLLLLLLTAGFVVAAILQLRRERALAALRSEFVSRVSHELRTPLTQIRMFAETLRLERVRSEDERKRSLEIIDQEAQRLGHLVENLLQLSRSERGRIDLSPTPTRMAPILRAVVESFRPLAKRKDVKIRLALDEALLAAIDPDSLRQIVLNLLDNAAKYGPEGQELLLDLQADDGKLLLSVDDQGPGVPAGQRDLIWKRFRRLKRDHDAAIAGAGIGLSVVRDLVERQGGTVRVEESERGGARFIIELPLVEAPGEPLPNEVPPGTIDTAPHSSGTEQ